MQVHNSTVKLLGAINLRTLWMFCLILLNKYFTISSLSCMLDPFTYKLVHSEGRQELLPQHNHDDLKRKATCSSVCKFLKNWKLTVTISFWSA